MSNIKTMPAFIRFNNREWRLEAQGGPANGGVRIVLVPCRWPTAPRPGRLEGWLRWPVVSMGGGCAHFPDRSRKATAEEVEQVKACFGL